MISNELRRIVLDLAVSLDGFIEGINNDDICNRQKELNIILIKYLEAY